MMIWYKNFIVVENRDKELELTIPYVIHQDKGILLAVWIPISTALRKIFKTVLMM